jgi:hypothetical protein
VFPLRRAFPSFQPETITSKGNINISTSLCRKISKTNYAISHALISLRSLLNPELKHTDYYETYTPGSKTGIVFIIQLKPNQHKGPNITLLDGKVLEHNRAGKVRT